MQDEFSPNELPETKEFWKQPIFFSSVFDDFGIKRHFLNFSNWTKLKERKLFNIGFQENLLGKTPSNLHAFHN